MSGCREDSPPKWDAAVAALLTERTHEKAAERAGIGVSTLRRWMTDKDFQRLYREARRQALDHAVGRLLDATNLAVDTLRDGLTTDNPAIQVRSAVAILELAYKGAEIGEIADRLEALEEAVYRQREGSGARL